MAAALVTRLFNQPINAHVMEWSANALPPDWEAIRAGWWTWHLVRVALSMGGAVLILVGALSERPSTSLA
ncbi:MAG TPA: anthrone oxygenase family protein [Devosia sp.]|nr:anthrone oxygenase family protein [Devosia sp.]